VWHWNVLASLAEALTVNKDSGWRTHVLLLSPFHISPPPPPCARLSICVGICGMSGLEEIVTEG